MAIRGKTPARRTSGTLITPFGIVAAFVTLTETALTYALTQVTNGVQIALTVFVIAYALLVAGTFFFILWNRPYVFYSPSEYAGTDPKEFIRAIHETMPERVVQQIEKVEESPEDLDAKSALIDSLIDEPVRQHLILMHERNVEIPFGWSIGQNYVTGGKHSFAKGSLSGRDLAQKLEGTGLVEIKPKGPSVALTQFGHEFAQWLVENGRKADFLQTPFGGWGTPELPEGAPPGFLKRDDGFANTRNSQTA